MKNPLNRRIPRSLKAETGRYAVLFIFIAGMIAIVSGFLVASRSISAAYDESFEKYNIEDGNFELAGPASDDIISSIEAEKLKLYENYYTEEENDDNDSVIRIFKTRSEANLVCMMEGALPSEKNEIAVDRMYAENNDLKTGDTISLNGRKLIISGLSALPDYSTLYRSPNDMMFDSVLFGTAVMTDEGFEQFGTDHLHYSYSWIWNDQPADDDEAKEMSDDLLKVIYSGAVGSKNQVKTFIPEYSNNAIHFAGEDIKGDNMMFTVFFYMVMIIIAFIFAVSTVNIISKEASVIGTLRASGYTKDELLRHYMAMPVIVMLTAAAVGNIAGYTLLKDVMSGLYYSSYSLVSYETLINPEAFVKTTVVPLLIMFFMNLFIIRRKLALPPLNFMRNDLKKKRKAKAFRLNTKIKIFSRFRLRILFQNIPDYVVVIAGIFMANVILLFGLGLSPLLDNYQEEIISGMPSKYQYILKMPSETETDGAEKFYAEVLSSVDKKLKSEEITVYGLMDDSAYIDADTASLKENEIIIANSFAEKFRINDGDIITLKETYGDKEYRFTVRERYYYPSSMAVFMNSDEFCSLFDREPERFSGYFSDNEITDIDDSMVAAKVTEADLTKTSRQLKVSMGSMMYAFLVFGIVMSMLIIYMLSKIILEKNAQSISMTKILGYTNGEINKLYIFVTSAVVLICIGGTIPLTSVILKEVLRVGMSSYPGWIPFNVPSYIYIQAVIMGVVSYIIVAAILMRNIKKIPMSNALRSAE